MTDAPTFYARARAETLALLGWTPTDNLSADQVMRLEVCTSLRLAVDDMNGKLARGEQTDVTKLLAAADALARYLPPPRDPPPPRREGDDPRQIMWETYLGMRRRGELGDRAAEPSLRAQIDQLRAENESLRAASSTAITPPTCDIVPPGERAECDPGPRPGPDDPRPPVVIEAKANPPPPPARKPFVKGLSDVPQHVRDTRPPNEAWRNFVKIDWQG
jgi:hypothetical protein